MTVACICITADRPEFTRQAVEYFLAQDYPHRKLLVFDTSANFPTRIVEPGVTHWREQRHQNDTIGGLRNRANSLAELLFQPDLMAHWDSDDYSAPGRLTDQVRMITESGKACAGYHSLKFTDGQQWWMYHGSPQYSVGTSLIYRTDWWRHHKFQEVNLGEDNQHVTAAWAAGQLATAHARELMWARIHPGNTAPKERKDNWELLK